MSGFKPGGLALIVKSYAGNEGKVVELIRHAGEMFLRIDRDDLRMDCWIVHHPVGIVTITQFDQITLEHISKVKEYPTAWMIPIPPLEEKEITEIEELLPVPEVEST
jgi:hypothetical protein